MPIFEVERNGEFYEVDAPDEQAAINGLQQGLPALLAPQRRPREGAYPRYPGQVGEHGEEGTTRDVLTQDILPLTGFLAPSGAAAGASAIPAAIRAVPFMAKTAVGTAAGYAGWSAAKEAYRRLTGSPLPPWLGGSRERGR